MNAARFCTIDIDGLNDNIKQIIQEAKNALYGDVLATKLDYIGKFNVKVVKDKYCCIDKIYLGDILIYLFTDTLYLYWKREGDFVYLLVIGDFPDREKKASKDKNHESSDELQDTIKMLVETKAPDWLALLVIAGMAGKKVIEEYKKKK